MHFSLKLILEPKTITSSHITMTRSEDCLVKEENFQEVEAVETEATFFTQGDYISSLLRIH